MSAPSSAVLAGLKGDSNLPLPTSSPSGSLNAKPTAKQSSLNIGPVSPATTRSKPSRRRGRINRLHPSWSPEGFHANLSARLESVADLLTHAGSGRILSASFATMDPATCSWRTSRPSAKKPSASSQPTWPRSGIAIGGTAYRLAGLGPHTSASGSSSLPTLTAHGGPNANANAKLWGEAKSLQEMARTGKGPTPNASDALKDRRNPSQYRRHTPTLYAEVVRSRWPTPRASPNENRGRKRSPSKDTGKHGKALAEEVGGDLSPDWVELLMGFPKGHSDIPGWKDGKGTCRALKSGAPQGARRGKKKNDDYPPSVTRSSRKSQKSSAGSSSNAKSGGTRK